MKEVNREVLTPTRIKEDLSHEAQRNFWQSGVLSVVILLFCSYIVFLLLHKVKFLASVNKSFPLIWKIFLLSLCNAFASFSLSCLSRTPLLHIRNFEYILRFLLLFSFFKPVFTSLYILTSVFSIDLSSAH